MKEEYQYKVVRFRKLDAKGNLLNGGYGYCPEFDPEKENFELSSVEDKMFSVELKDHFTKKKGAVCRNITENFINYYVPYSVTSKIDWASIPNDKAMVNLFNSYM